MGNYKNGYGPHILNNCEVRLEEFKFNKDVGFINYKTPLKHFYDMGIGILWLSVNSGIFMKNGLTFSLHPTTHNDYIFDFRAEGDDHEKRALFFGDPENGNKPVKPRWGIKFFRNPPMIPIDTNNKMSLDLVLKGLPTKDGKVLFDTMTPTLRNEEHVEMLKEEYHSDHPEVDFNIVTNLNSIKVLMDHREKFFNQDNYERRWCNFQKYIQNLFEGSISIGDKIIKFNKEKDLKTESKVLGCTVGWFMMNRYEDYNVNLELDIVDKEGKESMIRNIYLSNI